MRLIAISILTCQLCTGCAYFPPNPTAYAYVFDVGGPREITEWALRQHDAEQIVDAGSALGSLASAPRSDPEVAKQARQGFEQVYRKLASGWPGFTGITSMLPDSKTGPLSPELVDRNREYVFEMLFDRAARACHGPFATENRALYFRIQPTEGPQSRLDAWRNAAVEHGVLTPE